jgi:hypothetical protein
MPVAVVRGFDISLNDNRTSFQDYSSGTHSAAKEQTFDHQNVGRLGRSPLF